MTAIFQLFCHGAPFLQPEAIRALRGVAGERRGLRFLLHGGAAAGLLLDGRHAGQLPPRHPAPQPGSGPPAGGDHRAVRHPPPGGWQSIAAASGRRPYAHLVGPVSGGGHQHRGGPAGGRLGGPDHLPLGRGGIGMRLLYVHGGSRWKFDTEGGLYTDTSSNQDVWGPVSALRQPDGGAAAGPRRLPAPDGGGPGSNAFDRSRADWVALPDLYRPASNWFCPRLRWQVEKGDRPAGAPGRPGDRAGPGERLCRHRPAVGAPLPQALSDRGDRPGLGGRPGTTGRRASWPPPWRETANAGAACGQADWAVYVTRRALQKRYPTAGAQHRLFGCGN